jgi:hypothetical protein
VGAPNCQPASNASAHTSSYNEPAVRSGRVEVELLAAAKGRRDVRDQLVLARILSEHVAVAKVGLPGIENRSEIQIYDIVRRQAPVGRARVVGGERVNLVAEFTLEHAGTDQSAAYHLGEQLLGLVLGAQERLHGRLPAGLPGNRICGALRGQR